VIIYEFFHCALNPIFKRCRAIQSWASERGAGPTLDFEIFAKKVVFLVLSGKKQISPLLASPGKNLEKSSSAPPGKNPSDAQVYGSNLGRD